MQNARMPVDRAYTRGSNTNERTLNRSISRCHLSIFALGEAPQRNPFLENSSPMRLRAGPAKFLDMRVTKLDAMIAS